MGFNDFFINNNGKKEQLNNATHGVRREQVDKKFHNLFDAYDANGDGTLENEELGGIFTGLTKFSGDDRILDANENKQVTSLFANQAGIQDADFMGFVRSVSKAVEDIVDSKETPTADGGKEVTTTYKDGSVETISYYPDGEYKFKKLEQKGSTTTNYYTIGNNLDKHYTVDEIESRVKEAYDKRVAEIKQQAKQNSGIEGRGSIPIIPNYDEFKKRYLQHFNINQGSDTRNFERHDFELSERGKADVEVRDFVLNHYVETHKAAQEALETMGILDDVGAAINTGAGELWNFIKNVWNGTDEEYQNFYELSKKFEPNYNKALRESGSLDVMRNNPEMFFRDFEKDFKKDMGHQYNLENSVQFQQTAERYQNAQILKQRIDILNKAMQEIRMYQSEQDALTYAPAQNEGLNPASRIVSANTLLLQYFDNDQEAVNMLLNGATGNSQTTITAIKGLAADTQKMFDSVTDGKSFDEIKNDYQTQYRTIYGTDFVPDELTEKVMDAKATGGMVKLAAITVISVLITKSPVMAEISAAAGSAEATGAAANLVRTLVTKYGQTAVQQGIKFAMTSGTLATDVGLTLLNQATSERGINGEELWESTKGSAKYIFFGAYVGAPLAQGVSKALGKVGATGRLFEGGTKTANGAIQTTSISGDKLIQNFMKGGNKVLTTGGAFLTDVAAFTGLEVATEGANLTDALSEQGQMLSKLKLMNHVLEYMLGAKAHTATSRANLDAAIEKSGVKNWNIKEIKTPQKTQYVVDIDGLPVGKFEDANQLAAAMLERVTANFKTTQSFELKDKPEEPIVATTEKSPAKPSEGVKVETPKGKLNDVREASAENPAENAEAKILSEVARTEFNDEGIRLNTAESIDAELKEAELNPNAPVDNLETLSLVINGKLGKTLKSQYEKAGQVFEEIITKNADKIAEMEKRYSENPEHFATEFTKLLAEQLGVKGIEPKIEFVEPKDAGAAGYFYWPTGKLLINKELKNPKDIETIIAHEFVHVMQFKDIVAARGRDGIREIYLKNEDGKFLENKTREWLKEEYELDYDKETPQDQELYRNAVLDAQVESTLEANSGLTKFAHEHPLEKGSLNEYLSRIYQAENENMATFDTPEYYSQVIENEAYFLGNGKTGDKINISTELPAATHTKSQRVSENEVSIPAGKIETASNQEAFVEISVSNDEAEMIKRYNELQEESQKTGEVNEELLALTMELNDKGYHFKDGKLDFSYNENPANMPNSDVSKAEFIKGLKEYGIDETTLGNLEYNVNRINMDLLNKLKEYPELLNSIFGVSILCDVKPEDVPAKIEVLDLLKDIELLSPDSKVLMINKAGKNNLDAVKQNIEDFNYIKASGIDPSLIPGYGLAMTVDNMHFNREVFDLLKDNAEFADKPYLSFNVNSEDIPAKTEVYNLLKDSSCPVEQKVSILNRCNKDNLSKIKMIESYRADGIEEHSLRNLYEKLDDINENTLAAVKDNASLLDYYEVSDIMAIKPEDLSAKAKIALELFLFSIKKDSNIAQELIKQTTKDNIETIHKKMAMIQAFSPFLLAQNGIIRDIQDGSVDVDVVSDLFKTIKGDTELLKSISLNKDLKILKDVTAEDVKAKKEIYDFVFALTVKRMVNGKPILLHVDKADLLSRTTQDNVAEIKEEISLDYRIAEAESLKKTQFTEKEMLLRKNKLRTINESIDLQQRLSLDEKNQLKALFENAKTMEELDAKSNAYTAIVNKENGRLWSSRALPETLDAIKIKEQADIVDAVRIDGYSYFDGILSENFAKNYKYLKQVDSSFRPIEAGTFNRYAHYLKFDDIKSQEEFEMFKELWNDPKINDCSLISHIILDKNKYNAYKKISSHPDYLRTNNEDVSLVINAILRDEVSDITDVNSMAKDLRIKNIQEELKECRNALTQERYDWEEPATEKDIQGLTVTFPNLSKAKFENYSKSAISVIKHIINGNKNLSFNEIEAVLNSDIDFSNCARRFSILSKCSPEVEYKLAFCSNKDFNEVINVLEKRPEMLLEKFDRSSFDKMLQMSDIEWENFKVSIKDRGETEFNEAQYAADIQAKLDAGFELDMSTYRTIERQRKLEANSRLGYASKNRIKYEPSNNSERVLTPVEELPSAEQLLTQLKKTGKITLSIEDKGGMNPTRNDRAEIKEKDRDRLGQAVSTDIVLNIGASRPWENSRLARDIIQNFYDGNGYTMEGVDIQVEKVGDKYAVKISGKGIYDYDRVLNFGYGSKVNDTRSAGQHGEGSKIVLGNLLYSRGADHVKYSAGKWELDFTADKTKKPSESEIMQTLTEVEKAQDGTSLEFETTDLDLVKELVKAKDYFYSPQNKDFANLDFENEYFGMKFLPKGEKGNMYVIQRYEVEGSKGLDNTMDGMTLIFKTKPEDQTLTELNNGVPFSLETGRNRVALNRQKITEMITRYAKTLSDEQLINIIGNMKEVFLYDNRNKNTHILEGFVKVAQERNLEIDFGHDDYIAVGRYPDDKDVHFAKMMGKTLVTSEMAMVGVPDLYSYLQANEGHRTPVTELTETQAHKLQILEETVKMFSDNLDLANCGIITRGEAETPKYLYEPTEKDNTVAEAIISKGDDRIYQGHWVKADYFDSGDFFDLVATWLHETSHKVGHDGDKSFNDRLIKLEQLIVDMSNSDPSFGQKLRVLAQKYNEVSKKTSKDNSAYPKMTVRETDQMISDILRLVVTKAEEKVKVQQNKTVEAKERINTENTDTYELTNVVEPKTSDNILKRFFKKIFGRKKPQPVTSNITDAVKEKDQRYVYTSPKKSVRTSGENQFITYKDHIETLKTTGSLDITIPVTDELHPIKGSTEIKPADRAILDKTVNTPLMLDYNSAQEWTYDMVARDILQNFYDGHGGTLDGVKIDIQKVDGKYKIKISGESEYNYFYLKNIAASSKTGDENQAGGYGEGAKMASKSLLGAYVTDKITFASGDWAMDFAREEGVERQDMHMTRTLHENSQRVNGTYIEFETTSADLVESIIKAKDFYQHADNPDFKGLDFENDKFGFRILNENEKGNLYYNQRYAVKSEGELEGALNGISIVFKKELTTEDKERFKIANDCDRRGLTSEEIKSISTCMAKSMSDQELMSSIQQLERFWSIKDPRILKQNNRVITPEEGFAIGLVEEAGNRHLEFNVDAQKVAAVDPYSWDINVDHVNYLKSQGYVIADNSLVRLGFKTVKDVMKELNKVVPVEGTIVEKQKLALITEALPQKLPLKIFEASPDDNQVLITNENGEQFIAIDRRYLENTDFNTLYTQILSRINYASDSAEWGYKMTEMLAQQLRLANDPNYMTKFNTIANRFSQIK